MNRCPHTQDGEHRWTQPRSYVMEPPLGSPSTPTEPVQPSSLKKVTYQWCRLCDERRTLT